MFAIIGSIIGAILPYSLHALFGMLTGLVWLLVSFGVFGLWLFTMIKAFQGSRYVVPFIGPLAEKQANR